jgi:hypothetical protein
MTNSDAIEELPVAFRRGNSLEGVLPILGYMAGDQIGSRVFNDLTGDRIAIVAMTLAAGWAIVQRQRRGQRIGWWIPGIAVYLLIRGIAGLIWGEDVFLAMGIGVKVALGLAALGSVLIRRPLAAELSPMILPFSDDVRAHKLFRTTMRNLTLGYAVYQLVTVSFEIWLLGSTDSGTGFLIIRTLIGTASSFVGFILAIWYADRKMRPIPGFDGVLPMLERIGALIEADRASAAE